MKDFESGEDPAEDQEIKAFLEGGLSPKPVLEKQRQAAVVRSRFNLAQRDTILFAFVKIWTTIAELLAPLFAALATKHAHQHRNVHSQKPFQKDQ